MVQKGYMELEETLQQFKQKSHLLNLLEANKVVKEPEQDYLERFYEGTLWKNPPFLKAKNILQHNVLRCKF